MYPWRETLAGEGPGGTGGSLHLDLLQRLVELLLRVGADKPTVEVVKYFLVLQRTTYSHSIVVSDEHWLGLQLEKAVNEIQVELYKTFDSDPPEGVRQSVAEDTLLPGDEERQPGRHLTGLHRLGVPVHLARTQRDHSAGPDQLRADQVHHDPAQQDGGGHHHLVSDDKQVNCKE